MPVNLDKPHLWHSDIARSIDLYNAWFLSFAPEAYRTARDSATKNVESALQLTSYLLDITPPVLRANPEAVVILRMATAPPIARDRLIGLAGVPPNLVFSMEMDKRIPPRMKGEDVDIHLGKIAAIISRLADRDIFPWLKKRRKPAAEEIHRAATVVADRLCGAASDPIIRNAQERRQLALIKGWLEGRGYTHVAAGRGLNLGALRPGEFSFRLNVPGLLEDGLTEVNIPIDAAVMPLRLGRGRSPLLIEAKSAGDFTNTNKRRKEEATKIGQLRRRQGAKVRFILFLCGYFDSGYLGYEAASGIDWVWEHRIDDLAGFGL
jgi:hypothetical protein